MCESVCVCVCVSGCGLLPFVQDGSMRVCLFVNICTFFVCCECEVHALSGFYFSFLFLTRE